MLIGMAGIVAQLTDLELWLKVGIGMVSLFILMVRGAIAVVDLRLRLRAIDLQMRPKDSQCSQNSSSLPPTE